MEKLTRAHVAIIGAVVFVILGVGFYFLGIAKTRENTTQLSGRLQTANDTIAKRPTYEADLAKAKKEVAQVESDLLRFKATKMPRPPIDLRKQDPKSQVLAMMNLWQEPKRLYNMAQRFALSTDQVAVRTSFGVPAQPADPKLIPARILEIPIGSVTAYGDLQGILNYMRRWNRFGRVVAVDGLSLEGTSPLLQATAQLTVYIFPEVTPEQEAAAGPAAGGDMYGYGGYPGMGGPPGMMGPMGPMGPGMMPGPGGMPGGPPMPGGPAGPAAPGGA